MKPGIIHDYGITIGDFFKQIICKPIFEKGAVCRMTVTFNAVIMTVAYRANYIDSLKFFPACNIFNYFASRGTAVFALQIGVYSAFIHIDTLFMRNPV